MVPLSVRRSSDQTLWGCRGKHAHRIVGAGDYGVADSSSIPFQDGGRPDNVEIFYAAQRALEGHLAARDAMGKIVPRE